MTSTKMVQVDIPGLPSDLNVDYRPPRVSLFPLSYRERALLRSVKREANRQRDSDLISAPPVPALPHPVPWTGQSSRFVTEPKEVQTDVSYCNHQCTDHQRVVAPSDGGAKKGKESKVSSIQSCSSINSDFCRKKVRTRVRRARKKVRTRVRRARKNPRKKLALRPAMKKIVTPKVSKKRVKVRARRVVAKMRSQRTKAKATTKTENRHPPSVPPSKPFGYIPGHHRMQTRFGAGVPTRNRIPASARPARRTSVPLRPLARRSGTWAN